MVLDKEEDHPRPGQNAAREAGTMVDRLGAGRALVLAEERLVACAYLGLPTCVSYWNRVAECIEKLGAW